MIEIHVGPATRPGLLSLTWRSIPMPLLFRESSLIHAPAQTNSGPDRAGSARIVTPDRSSRNQLENNILEPKFHPLHPPPGGGWHNRGHNPAGCPTCLAFGRPGSSLHPKPGGACDYSAAFPSGRSSGNRITSRIDFDPVRIIVSRSIPMPSPAVGGSPYPSART